MKEYMNKCVSTIYISVWFKGHTNSFFNYSINAINTWSVTGLHPHRLNNLLITCELKDLEPLISPYAEKYISPQAPYSVGSANSLGQRIMIWSTYSVL